MQCFWYPNARYDERCKYSNYPVLFSFLTLLSISTQLWRLLQASDFSTLRDCIANRFMALICTIIALSMSPLSLYRIFQIKFCLVGGSADDAANLLLAIPLNLNPIFASIAAVCALALFFTTRNAPQSNTPPARCNRCWQHRYRRFWPDLLPLSVRLALAPGSRHRAHGRRHARSFQAHAQVKRQVDVQRCWIWLQPHSVV